MNVLVYRLVHIHFTMLTMFAMTVGPWVHRKGTPPLIVVVSKLDYIICYVQDYQCILQAGLNFALSLIVFEYFLEL